MTVRLDLDEGDGGAAGPLGQWPAQSLSLSLSQDMDVRRRLLQLGHASIRHLRAAQIEHLKLRQPLQMCEARVRHLRAGQMELLKLRQVLQMPEPRIRHLHGHEPPIRLHLRDAQAVIEA